MTRTPLLTALVLCLGLAAPMASASDCPDPKDHAAREAEVIGQLQNAPTEGVARQLNATLWEIWLDAPDAAAKAMLTQGMARNPRHVGALSGKALTLMGLGRAQMAQDVLREALALNPWLPERVYLVDDSPKGDDI